MKKTKNKKPNWLKKPELYIFDGATFTDHDGYQYHPIGIRFGRIKNISNTGFHQGFGKAKRLK